MKDRRRRIVDGRKTSPGMSKEQARRVAVAQIKKVSARPLYGSFIEVNFEGEGSIPLSWCSEIRKIRLLVWKSSIKYRIKDFRKQKRKIILELTPNSWLSALLFHILVRRRAEDSTNIRTIEIEMEDGKKIEFGNSLHSN